MQQIEKGPSPSSTKHCHRDMGKNDMEHRTFCCVENTGSVIGSTVVNGEDMKKKKKMDGFVLCNRQKNLKCTLF